MRYDSAPARRAQTTGIAAVPPRFELAWWVPAAIFCAAFLLRLWRFEFTWPYVDDTLYNVPTATLYSLHGLLGPDNWWTQPLKHLLLQPLTQLFGQEVLVWRMRAIATSAGSAVLIFLVGRRAFGRPFHAIAATVLFALDPLSAVMGRTTSEDIPAVFFMLLATWFFLRVVEEGRDRDLLGFGLACALAFSLRWYCGLPATLMLLILAWRGRSRGLPWFARLVGYVVALPSTIYLFAYLQWFARGFTIADWVQLQIDAVRVQGAAFGFAQLDALAGPSRWMSVFVDAAMPLGLPAGGAETVMTSDPVLWFAFVPLSIFGAWASIRRRDVGLAALAGSFLLLFGFFVVSPRPIYLYSAIVVVPFGLLASTYAVGRLPGRWKWWALGVAVVWSLYLFPLAMSLPFSKALYPFLGGL